MKSPTAYRGSVTVQPVKFVGEDHPRSRATLATAPALRVGDMFWVRTSEPPTKDEWAQTRIVELVSSTIVVERM